MKRQDDRAAIRPSFNKKSGGEQESTESKPRQELSTMRAFATSSSRLLNPTGAERPNPSTLAPFAEPHIPNWEPDHPIIQEWTTTHRNFQKRRDQNGLEASEEWLEKVWPKVQEQQAAGWQCWLVGISTDFEPNEKRVYLVFCTEPPIPGKALLLKPILRGSRLSSIVMWTSYEVESDLLDRIWAGAALGRRFYVEEPLNP